MNIKVYDWMKEVYREVNVDDFESRLRSINIDLDEKDVSLKDIEYRLFNIKDEAIEGIIRKDSFIQVKPFYKINNKICCSLAVIL